MEPIPTAMIVFAICITMAVLVFMVVTFCSDFVLTREVMQYILDKRMALQRSSVLVGYDPKRNKFYLYKSLKFKKLKIRKWYGKLISYKHYSHAINISNKMNEVHQ